MKDTLKDSDFIKPGYENLYGKVFLVNMKNHKRGINGIILLILLIISGDYYIPNFGRSVLSSNFIIINRIRIVLTLLICLFVFLRIWYIYQSSQPWKFGLEFSIYFNILICLVGISSLFFAVLMTEYVYGGNYFFVNLSIILTLVFIMRCLIIFGRRGDIERESFLKVTERMGSMKRIKILGGVLGAIVVFFTFPQEETIPYVATLILLLISSVSFAMLICDIYCLFYKEGIDYDVFYEFTDGIDPNKQYPPNFGDVKKKVRKK